MYVCSKEFCLLWNLWQTWTLYGNLGIFDHWMPFTAALLELWIQTSISSNVSPSRAGMTNSILMEAINFLGKDGDVVKFYQFPPWQIMPHTVDGRNPAPVEVGSLSLHFQSFTHPRWLLGISSINSIGNITPTWVFPEFWLSGFIS